LAEKDGGKEIKTPTPEKNKRRKDRTNGGGMWLVSRGKNSKKNKQLGGCATGGGGGMGYEGKKACQRRD